MGKEVAAFVLSLVPITEACFLMEQEARHPGLGSLPGLHRAVFSPGRRSSCEHANLCAGPYPHSLTSCRWFEGPISKHSGTGPSALSLSVVQWLFVRLFHFLSGVHDEAPQFVR